MGNMTVTKTLRQQARNLKVYIHWYLIGRPLPPPHIVKQAAIRRYQKQFHLDTMIESGTFMGDMVFEQLPQFKKIISIELSKEFYDRAVQRFNEFQTVDILHGDSSELMPQIVPTLTAPALFWLDGHYSGGDTAKASLETPVIAELESIFESSHSHVVLIDDARLFTGEHDYPTIAKLQQYVDRKRYTMIVKDDIIRLLPTHRK